MEQLQGIGGGRSVGFGPNKVRSLPDAIAKAIGMHFGFSGASVAAKASSDDPAAASVNLNLGQQIPLEEKVGDICPSCGAPALVYEEGCAKCHACGHSEC
jgi:ribonucleoside-diphosphate reductase alpha chain